MPHMNAKASQVFGDPSTPYLVLPSDRHSLGHWAFWVGYDRPGFSSGARDAGFALINDRVG